MDKNICLVVLLVLAVCLVSHTDAQYYYGGYRPYGYGGYGRGYGRYGGYGGNYNPMGNALMGAMTGAMMGAMMG